jgi:hypothetical protein
MEPASTVIERLGGPKVVSTITGAAYTAPYRWQHPREKGGTGGLIPQKHHLTLLAYAKQHGIPLTAADFLPATSIVEPLAPSPCDVAIPTSGGRA